MFELRYYFNKRQYEVLDSYRSISLAYGMRKKFAMREQYQLSKLKIINTSTKNQK